MTRTQFYSRYKSEWPGLANASLLVDLYRTMGCKEPEREALTGYVHEDEVEKGIRLLKSIGDPVQLSYSFRYTMPKAPSINGKSSLL